MSKKLKEITCLKIAKQRTSKMLILYLSVKWSDGSNLEEKTLPYSALFNFQTALKERYKDQEHIHLPDLPDARKLQPAFLFGNSEEKRRSVVDEYFKKLIQLPDHVVCSHVFQEFFEFEWSEEFDDVYTQRLQSTKEEINDDDVVVYETVKDHNLPVVKKQQVISDPPAVPLKKSSLNSSNNSVSTTTVPADAEENIYWAHKEYSKRSSGEVTLSAGNSVSVLQKSLTGWWFVEVKETNEQGWAPGSLLLPADRNDLADTNVSKTPNEFQAIRDFNGQGPDEISYKKGMRVKVLQAKLDGWWEVSCQGKTGFTPSVNLEPVSSQKGPAPKTNPYNMFGVYGMNNPPPRRVEEDSIEELYAQVDKMRSNNSSKSKRTAPTAPVAPIDEVYSQIGPEIQLVAEDYQVSENNADNKGLTKPSKPVHSYVNVIQKETNRTSGTTASTTKLQSQQQQASASIQNSLFSAVVQTSCEAEQEHSRPPTKAKPVTVSKKTAAGMSDMKLACGQQSGSPAPKSSGSSPRRNEAVEEAVNRDHGKPAAGRLVVGNQSHVSTQPIAGQPSANVAFFQPPISDRKPEDDRSGSSNLAVLNIGRPESDRLLTEYGNIHDYVIRSSSKPGCPYAISVLGRDGCVHHFPIALTSDQKFYIGRYYFASLDEVIAYYTKEILLHTAAGDDIILGKSIHHPVPT